MKLRELQATFQRIAGPRLWQRVDSLSEADGVLFLCPKCFAANGGPIGTHSVVCWRPHVPQTESPIPGRWQFEGSGLDDLTLVAGSSSVQLVGGCNAHFYVRGGAIQMCPN